MSVYTFSNFDRVGDIVDSGRGSDLKALYFLSLLYPVFRDSDYTADAIDICNICKLMCSMSHDFASFSPYVFIAAVASVLANPLHTSYPSCLKTLRNKNSMTKLYVHYFNLIK